MAEVEHRADTTTITTTQQSHNNTSSFIFTCFGAFLNVTDNPSRKVAKQVQSTLTAINTHGQSVFTDIPVHELEVSKDYVLKYFDDMYHQLEADLRTQQQQQSTDTSSSSPPPTVFLIHFGVHRCASHIHIERRGLNCAHYHPGPDANGFLCQNQPILTPPSSSGSTSSTPAVEFFPPATNSKLWSAVGSTLAQNLSPVSVLRGGANSSNTGDSAADDNLRLIRGFIETPISLKWVEDTCREVNSAIYGGDDVDDKNTTSGLAGSNDQRQKMVELKPSHDAGQYLCNTALFCSLAVTTTLQQQQQATAAPKENTDTPTTSPRYVSLFIHVVNEEVLAVDRQAALVSAFLLKLQQTTSFL